MKHIFKICLLLFTLITEQQNFAQSKNDHSIKNNTMKTTVNKEIIRTLYEKILNDRNFELFDSIVSKDCTNSKGEKGIETFKKGIIEIINAIPDAKWAVIEMIAEENKIFVKQKVEGTHKGLFQHISATGKSISNEGYAVYELKDGKIINYQVQTDRLGFLQQLGILPSDLTTLSQDKESIFFVDKFFIPKNAINEFITRMEYNWDFIKPLPGFIKHEVIVQNDTNGNLILMTIATWKNQESLDRAKILVQTEYQRTNFNPQQFMEKLDIKMERQMYNAYIK